MFLTYGVYATLNEFLGDISCQLKLLRELRSQAKTQQVD